MVIIKTNGDGRLFFYGALYPAGQQGIFIYTGCRDKNKYKRYPSANTYK